MSETVAKPAVTTVTSSRDTAETPTSIEVVLSFRVDLRLLRRQKRALIDIRHNSKVSAGQEDAIEGILNMIDFIQDSIVDQGLAREEEVFPQMPLLFETAA
jgi:hypothetical protein